ncbi:MAG: type II toxin-antitoxin system VapC family toxin [Polyangiaceae bacterium]|nr:type II toxin-antitoxin system VapC family toxin [Polyangiaceae bacterium]
MSDEPILLDTCTFLDWAFGARVGKTTLRRLDQAAREGRVHLSPLSVQEILRLAEKGRLDLQPTGLSWVRRALRTMRVEELSFTWAAAEEAGGLTDVNGDPVDRGLLGAAIANDMVLLTRDEDLLEAARRKSVRVIDSRR